jgi:hypothetical protein
MPMPEDLKEYADRASSLRRAGRRKACPGRRSDVIPIRISPSALGEGRW